MMITFIKYSLVISLVVGSYMLGHYRTKSYYDDLNNKVLADSITKFNNFVEAEKAKQLELERVIEKYEVINRELSANNADLLMRIKNSSSTRCTLPTVKDKSNASKENTNGRSTSLADVLREATLIIAERDQIANLYNELREQCRLK